MLSNTVCQFVTLISCIGTILSAYIAMKMFKMGTLSFLNKMFAFYFVFDAFQGCLQNYAMLPLFYERYRKKRIEILTSLSPKSSPKSNLKGEREICTGLKCLTTLQAELPHQSAFSEKGPFLLVLTIEG